MNRRQLLALAALSALDWGAPSAAWAVTPRKFRVYMITWRGRTAVEKGFEDYLAAAGVPADFIWRDANQRPERLAEFAAEIAQLKPDLIYTWGTSTTLGVVGSYDQPRRVVGDIPVVFTLVASPVGAKIVPQLIQHARNLTGVVHLARLHTQLEAMRAYRPFDTLGVLYNRAEENSVAVARELAELAAAQGVTLVERTFKQDRQGRPLAEGIAARVAELKAAGAQWLYLGVDSFLFTQLKSVAAAALAARLPTFAATEAVMNHPEAGVLAGLVSKYYNIGQFAAHKAIKILTEGTPAAHVPIEAPQRHAFVIRMDTARALNLLPPVGLFDYAEVL